MNKLFPVLYKLSTDGVRINQWQVEVQGKCFRTISGFKGMKQTTSEWTCCEPKNIGKANATTADEQAMQEAEALHRKRIEKGFVDDPKNVGQHTKFEPMLANKYEDEKELVLSQRILFSQPKLDGVRCIVRKDGMWTRNGKPIISAPHIWESMKHLFVLDPTLIFDGELYCDRLSNDFNKIISLVKKTKPTIEDLKESEKYIEYHIYDLPTTGKTSLPFSERYLETKNDIVLPKYCVWVETNIMDDPANFEADINKFFSHYVDKGYEGQIIRLNGPYQNKRSKYLIKHKAWLDEEFPILDVIEGKGNMAGKVGKLVFENCSAPINASWEELEAYWKRKNELIGKTATIKYFGYTEDGSLRFPKVTMIDRWTWE